MRIGRAVLCYKLREHVRDFSVPFLAQRCMILRDIISLPLYSIVAVTILEKLMFRLNTRKKTTQPHFRNKTSAGLIY